MQLKNEIYNDSITDEHVDGSGDEDAENDEGDEDDVSDSQEDDDEDGDELEDDEDEPPEMPTSNIATEAAPKKKQSQGGDTKNVVSKKEADGVAAARKPQGPVAKLVIEAIKHLNEKSGSSAVAIKRVIISNHPDINERRLGIQMKRYIKSSLDNGTMVQIKRSFKITKKLDKEEKKLAKAREKARREKLKAKAKERDKKQEAKEKGKNHKTKKMASDAKQKTKSAKRPSPNDDKGKPSKEAKLDGAASNAAKGRKDYSTKGPAAKSKLKVRSRKSINLLIKHTPPRPKTMKKLKPTSDKQKPKSSANAAVAGTSKAAATNSGRGKQKNKDI